MVITLNPTELAMRWGSASGQKRITRLRNNRNLTLY